MTRTAREVVELYRIAQEAVTNALKHAHAKRIDVELSSDVDSVSLVIADDGRGLPRDGEAGHDGSGAGDGRGTGSTITSPACDAVSSE